MRCCHLVILLLLIGCGGTAPTVQTPIRHVTVDYEEGRFSGWPANFGIWSWDNEVLVGFSKGYHKELGPKRHSIDRDKPEVVLLARSLDGGESWSIEDPSADGVLVARGAGLHGTESEATYRRPAARLAEPIDFGHPDLALIFRFLDHNKGPSYFYHTYDRGRRWIGPHLLEVSGRADILARTDYVVLNQDSCMVFLSLSKADSTEGRPVCAVTYNGGLDWHLRSLIGEAPSGFGIMPSTVQLREKEYLTTVRRREGDRRWIDAYRSTDDGHTWLLEPPPIDDLGEGNPPSLIKLTDGRLCLTYGVRGEPYRIAAKLSSDEGKTWSDEIVLRDDGAGRDLGYVRSVQRPDGQVLVVYYFQDHHRPERYIGATIWDPGKVDQKR